MGRVPGGRHLAACWKAVIAAWPGDSPDSWAGDYRMIDDGAGLQLMASVLSDRTCLDPGSAPAARLTEHVCGDVAYNNSIAAY